MTKAWFVAALLSTLVGCGSSGNGDFSGDSGGTGEPDGSSSSDSTVDGRVFSDGPVLNMDSTTGGDTGHISDTGGLDISFDGIVGPDEGTSDGTGPSDGTMTGCSPDGITCSGTTAVTCSGGVETTQACSGSTSVCAAGYGCVLCTPGSGSCSGSTGTLCNSTGTAETTNDCDPELGLTCLGGTCTGACADIGESYIGCEYYAITMANNQLNQSVFPFYVVVANQGTSAATLTITGGALTTTDTVTVAAGAIQEIELPWVPALSCGGGTCDGDDTDYSSPGTELVATSAYHIKSTEPITAYQFNAKDYVISGTYSYTNDASLLLPVNAMTGNYYVATWGSWNAEPAGVDANLGGTIAVVGTAAGTTVTITAPGSAFQAGAGLTATGGTVTLNAGDVLQIEANLNSTDGVYGTDPSGTLIKASAPVEVFGGSDCTYIPASVPACDHIEQINFPLETLGTSYLVTVPYNDNDQAPNMATPDPGHGRQYVKIIGTVAGTTLTYDGITAPTPTTIGAGGVVFFQALQNFHVTASQPIEVAQFMESQNNFGTACVDETSQSCGDPSMSQAVATAQFRESYGFSAPANYYENWVNVIAPTGTTVTVTDTPTNHTITTGSAIGSSSGYYVANVALCANNLAGCTGNHTATASKGFGIEVYGYGSYTSYMYPGGLNLTR
jgi:hypothetical protein